MIDQRLIRANATKLDELNRLMAEQEGADRLCSITMKDISIGHGASEDICAKVRRLTEGKRLLMVTGPTEILDTQDRNVKQRIAALLEAEFELQRLVITEPEGIVHCTPENAEKIKALLPGVDCVVAVGSGTVCDLSKYATSRFCPENPTPLVVVQTALSVNAFSDDSSVMLISGVKRTVHSRYPSVLIIDLDIVAAAPDEMNVSGYGDLIATWTAPVDWYLGNVLGMGKNFHTAPSDMIRTQCEELLENSACLADGDTGVLYDLANVLTLSGLSMGLANESSPASGSEHVMSHLIDMTAGVRGTGICYHGTQVAVSGIISEIIWDWFMNEFDAKAVDPAKCYPDAEEMERRVKDAFGWISDATAEECWADYQVKLSRWHENRDKFEAFLRDFEVFKTRVRPWLKKPEYIAACMHRAMAPTRYSALNYPVDAKTVHWAVSNCHLMRNRFSIIDLLNFTGYWNEAFVQMLIDRAESMDAGL